MNDFLKKGRQNFFKPLSTSSTFLIWKVMPAKQTFRWDWTLFTTKEEEWESVFKIILIPSLKSMANKWCFQLEKAPTTGGLHFQGRMSLKAKTRAGALWKTLTSTWNWTIALDALSQTSRANMGNNLYVIKEDTRVKGPWSDKDFRELPETIRLPEGKGMTQLNF